MPSGVRCGISILELLVALAILGVLAGLATALLPRQGFAVSQGERLLAAAIQSGRFDAIRSNQNVVVRLGDGATEVTISSSAALSSARTVSLDPQGGRVAIKSPDVEEIEFNARGVLVDPMPRSLTLGVLGQDRFDVELSISPQGVLTRR